MELEEYVGHDATGLASLVRSGEVTAAELTRLAREAHDRVNPSVNAVIELYEDAEAVPASGAGPFGGVPFLRKDLGPSEAGRLQEQGSRLARGYRPTTESHYVRHARAGGLRIVGRTTTPEFGMSGLSESWACGITHNPWNLDLTAGGSSAGSSVAVATGIVPIAHASDAGGSIRIPAANCGLVGLNPSRGRVSGGPDQQDAASGMARDFVVCRTVRDAAAALDVFSGTHPGDPFAIVKPERPYVEELDRPAGRLRIGVATTAWGELETSAECRDAVARTATLLQELGHAVEEIPAPFVSADLRRLNAGRLTYALADLDDFAHSLGRVVDERTVEPVNLELYREAKRRPLAYASSIFEGIRKIRAEVGETTAAFDLLLTPTMPCTALPHGTYSTTNEELSAAGLADAHAALYQYLAVFNLTGQPSISLPLFHSTEGMPIGVQLVGRFGDEAPLIRISADLERMLPWASRRPPVFAAPGA